MSTQKSKLAGKVCIVTGATRGIGKGIALQLAQAGVTVYITGRTLKSSSASTGSLEDTIKEIEARGGRAIPVVCDHSKDEEVVRLFQRVKTEQNGQLDVLVNNAYSALLELGECINVPFWEQADNAWDHFNGVGLRNHYICSMLAARLMVPRKTGLIVNISSMGGLVYYFNVLYGVGKEACDRMAVDCARDLKNHNVAFVSIWPGPTRTWQVPAVAAFLKDERAEQVFNKMFEEGAESIEYTGRAIAHLAADPDVMKKSGRVWTATDLNDEYNFTDVDGKRPWNTRSVHTILARSGNSYSSFVPMWIKIPKWIFSLQGSKL